MNFSWSSTKQKVSPASFFTLFLKCHHTIKVFNLLTYEKNLTRKWLIFTSFVFMKSCKGLLDGYVAEKAILEEMLQQKETQEESLVEELEDLKMKMHQMQGLTAELDSLRLKHQQLAEEHAAVLRQKDHLSAGLGEREKGKQSKHKILSYAK